MIYREDVVQSGSGTEEGGVLCVLKVAYFFKLYRDLIEDDRLVIWGQYSSDLNFGRWN